MSNSRVMVWLDPAFCVDASCVVSGFGTGYQGLSLVLCVYRTGWLWYFSFAPLWPLLIVVSFCAFFQFCAFSILLSGSSDRAAQHWYEQSSESVAIVGIVGLGTPASEGGVCSPE